MKTCNSCGECKPLTAYHADSRRPDGHHNACRACRSRTTLGIRYDGHERKANRDFSRAMASLPVFSLGIVGWTV